jgi:transcription antitermination factor NusB
LNKFKFSKLAEASQLEQIKMPENTFPKSAGSRRMERAKAFQILYSLCFNPPENQSDLARRFQRAIYAKPKPGSIFSTELTEEQTQTDETTSLQDASGVSAAGKKARILPDIRAACSEQEKDEPVVTPDPKIYGIPPEGFAWELVRGVWNKLAELDEQLRAFSQNWRLERMGRVELSLLRLAVYELLFSADVPPKVIINEAIELSRQFGDEHSHGFVNGILDAVVKAVEKGEVQRGGFFS